LLIENDPSHGESVRKVLSGCGAEIVMAHDLKQTLELLDQEPRKTVPDLIIVHRLPCKSHEAGTIDRIRNHELLKKTPVLVLTETVQEKEMLEQFRFPLCACSVAPLNLTKLIYALPALGMKINDSILYANQQSRENARL
jgi:DNA-binding response OmpR family regulator